MRPKLSRHSPLDAILRWWYLMIAGPGAGLVFSLVTDYEPFQRISKILPIGETIWITPAAWKNDVLFPALGFLLAIALIWLLEEIRAYNQDKG